MSIARYIIGDTRDVLKTLPDASVDLILTSPPFLALRSYLPADHPDKAREIGSEATPGAFLDVLLDVVVELRRVLAPHGSLCVELGDTYSGSGGAGGDYAEGGLRDGQPRFKADPKNAQPDAKYGNGRQWEAERTRRAAKRDTPYPGWPLAKSLCMVPQSFAFALAYGRNPWTGRTIEPWRVRNIVRWCRPNPPVGALGDKFRPATSEMVVACTGGSRYFDLDAVREPHKEPHWTPGDANAGPKQEAARESSKETGRARFEKQVRNPAGAPPLDYWVIPTHPYPGSHYATYPPELCVRPIKAMCPERVCRVCGKPSERIVEKSETYAAERVAIKASSAGAPSDEAIGKAMGAQGARFIARESGFTAHYETLGWSDCGHDDWRRGIVLDPFAGSGTTLEVATGHGRDAIGIDLDPRNGWLARDRIGMFLTLEESCSPAPSSSESS